MNHEGYRDPTADQAVRNAEKIPRRIKDVMRAMNAVASLHGLEIVTVREMCIRDRFWEGCRDHF